ncbi:Uncharacterised protein [Streptococcus criceti]|nr:Uncharacterised protein [Streptococcus criceti]
MLKKEESGTEVFNLIYLVILSARRSGWLDILILECSPIFRHPLKQSTGLFNYHTNDSSNNCWRISNSMNVSSCQSLTNCAEMRQRNQILRIIDFLYVIFKDYNVLWVRAKPSWLFVPLSPPISHSIFPSLLKHSDKSSMVVNKVNHQDGQDSCQAVKRQFHKSRWQIGIKETPPQKIPN